MSPTRCADACRVFIRWCMTCARQGVCVVACARRAVFADMVQTYMSACPQAIKIRGLRGRIRRCGRDSRTISIWRIQCFSKAEYSASHRPTPASQKAGRKYAIRKNSDSEGQTLDSCPQVRRLACGGAYILDFITRIVADICPQTRCFMSALVRKPYNLGFTV